MWVRPPPPAPLVHASNFSTTLPSTPVRRISLVVQPRVVAAEQMEQRPVQVVDVDAVLDDVEASGRRWLHLLWRALRAGNGKHLAHLLRHLVCNNGSQAGSLTYDGQAETPEILRAEVIRVLAAVFLAEDETRKGIYQEGRKAGKEPNR